LPPLAELLDVLRKRLKELEDSTTADLEEMLNDDDGSVGDDKED